MRRPSLTFVRMFSACFAATGIVLLLGATAWAQPAVVQGTVSQLDCPDAGATIATDINDSGTVVGLCNPGKVWRGFAYADGTFVFLDFAGASRTEAWGINERGDIVGFYYLPGDPLYHGYLKHASGGWETIDRNGAMNTMPEDINDAGYVVGCIHNNGLMTAFVWKDGAFVSIEPSNSMFTGINESGTAIGYAFAPPSGTDSFILSGVGRVEFSHLNTAGTLALGLNQAGDIVGWYPFGSTGARAFLRRHDGVMAEVDVFGANVTKAFGINEAGTIVGVTGPGTHGFVLVQSQ